MDIVTLAESVGNVHEVGWWHSHGNAIELLTGIENLFGANSFEAAAQTKAIRNLDCEPLTNSSLRYVIAHEAAISVIRECKAVKLIAVSTATDHGMVLVTLKRKR